MMNSKRTTETDDQPPAKIAKRTRGRSKKVEDSSLEIPSKEGNTDQNLKKRDSKLFPSGSDPAGKKNLTKETSKSKKSGPKKVPRSKGVVTDAGGVCSIPTTAKEPHGHMSPSCTPRAAEGAVSKHQQEALEPPTEAQLQRFSAFQPGQIVWAFQQGFPMWPGLIQGVCSKTGAAVITFIDERNGKVYSSTTELLPQNHPEKEVIRDFAPNFANLTKSDKRWKKQGDRRSILKAIRMVCEEIGLPWPKEPKDLWEYAKSDSFASMTKIVITQDVYNRCFEGIPQGLVPTPKHKRVKLISDNLEDSSASTSAAHEGYGMESEDPLNTSTVFYCPDHKCGRGVYFPEKAQWKKHVFEEHSGWRFRCLIEDCKEEFELQKQANSHWNKVHKLTRGTKPKIGRFRRRRKVLESSKKGVHHSPSSLELQAFPYSCKVCMSGYTTLDSLAVHMLQCAAVAVWPKVVLMRNGKARKMANEEKVKENIVEKMKEQDVGESSVEGNIHSLPFDRRAVSARKSINRMKPGYLIPVALPPQVDHDDSGYEPKELVNENIEGSESVVEEKSEEDNGEGVGIFSKILSGLDNSKLRSSAAQPYRVRNHKCNRCGAKFTIDFHLWEHMNNMKHW